MEFVISNLFNCCIENLILIVLFSLFTTQETQKKNYTITYMCLFGCSCIVTFIDSFLFSILPFNFLLIFLCFIIGFHFVQIKNILWDSIISYLLLIYFQVIFVCLYPAKLMGSHLGNFLVNTSTLIITVIFYLISKRVHFQETFIHNKWIIRVFFLALCIPEFITVQFFVSLLNSAPKIIMICLLLLQLLYVTLLLLILFLITYRQERRQFQNTKEHFETLNQILDNSKQSIHDFNKHIRYLQNTVTVYLKKQQYTELQHQIDLYCGELLEKTEKEESILHLDDPILRALLYGRQAQAKINNIDLYIDAISTVLPSFPLKNYQIVEIFDNLLDNAFECVENLPENRWIKIVLYCEKAAEEHFKNILCVQNPYDELDFSAVINDKSYSSKQGDHKGIGLKKIAKLVTETKGTLILNNENHIFSAKIIYLN